MAANKDEGVYEFLEFQGLRNTVDPERLNAEELEVAQNVDIDDSLAVSRRKGFSAALVAGSASSIWSDGSTCLVVLSGTTLARVLPDWSTVTLRTDMSGDPVSYSNYGTNVGYSDGKVSGMVQRDGTHRSWGILPPSDQPTATESYGSLPAGRYQYAVTFVRPDGQESGTGPAGVIPVAEGGAIDLSNIPVSDDSGVDKVRIYVSRRDGETLYHYGEYSNGTTTASINDEVPDLAWPLETQFKAPPPPGQAVAEYNGHALVADGSTLYYSEPFAYELFDLRKNFRFRHPIKLIIPMESGVYLGTSNNIFWLPGQSPSEWKLDEGFSYGAIPGTAHIVSRDMIFKGEGSGPVAVFHSTQGICVAADGGQITNITQEKFTFPEQTMGAGIVRRHRGSVQYLSTLQGAGGAEATTGSGAATLPSTKLNA